MPVTGTVRAALLYVLLTILLAWPLSIRPGSSLLADDPDIHLFMWTLAWNTHAFLNQPLAIFDANIFHPYPDTLAYSENLLGSALIAAPILWLTDNPVLALNLVALFSCVLSGLGAYVLGRRLGMSVEGAFLCGLIFAFSPARFFRISQAHLTAVQWIPFTLAALHAYLDERRPRHLRLAAAFFSLQAITSGHGAVFVTVAVGVLLAYRGLRGEPLAITRRVRDVGVTGVLLLLPTALIFLPYRRVQAEMGLRRTLNEWAPTWESFLASPTHLHSFLLSLVPDARINELAYAFLFPGYLPVLLAGVGLLAARRRSPVAIYGLLALVSIWLSLGPPVGLWPHVYWLPGLNFIRVPYRFMILAVLALAVLAAFGFERLSARLGSTRRLLLAAGIGALLLAEFIAIPLRVVPFRLEIPAADRWLAGRSTPFVVAEVPATPAERYQTTYMLHSIAHWQRTVHGYSGILPPLHHHLYSQLESFPDEESLRTLRDLGIDYVVVHIDMYEPGDWFQIQARLTSFSHWLQLEYAGPRGRVYSLRDVSP